MNINFKNQKVRRYLLGTALALLGVSLLWLLLLDRTPLRDCAAWLAGLAAQESRWGLLPLFYGAPVLLGAGLVLWLSGRLELRLWGKRTAWKRPRSGRAAGLVLALVLLGHGLTVLWANALYHPGGAAAGVRTWAQAYTAAARYVYTGELVLAGLLAIFRRMRHVAILHRES